MNKSGFGIIGFTISTLIMSISALIFSYQISSLKLLNLKTTTIFDSGCKLINDFSLCDAAIKNTKFIKLDYNFLFREAINCNILCNEKKIVLNNEQKYLGSLSGEELVNSRANLLAATGNITIGSLKTSTDLIIIAFKKIEIENISCSGNSVFIYSLLSEVNIASNSNCGIIATSDAIKNLKQAEKVILRATY